MKKSICCSPWQAFALGGSAQAELARSRPPAATLLLPYFRSTSTTTRASTRFSRSTTLRRRPLSPTWWCGRTYGGGPRLQRHLPATATCRRSISAWREERPAADHGQRRAGEPGRSVLDPDGNSYPACDELGFPYDNTDGGDASCGELGCVRLADVQEILRGNESTYIYPGACAALPTGGGAIADGYVTVDLISDCTLQTPCGQGWSNPDQGPYFGEGNLGLYDNILWGDYFYINGGENFAQGDNLVHIQALYEEEVPRSSRTAPSTIAATSPRCPTTTTASPRDDVRGALLPQCAVQRRHAPADLA
ncbi:MAG: hypothetical protein R2862_09270 [Thermoanaerobaculia bacterium]